jgi:hypothetical protein
MNIACNNVISVGSVLMGKRNAFITLLRYILVTKINVLNCSCQVPVSFCFNQIWIFPTDFLKNFPLPPKKRINENTASV